jgi:hypothetical protein
MKPHFLFPPSPLNSRMIDEAFQDQAIALKQAGFNTSIVNLDTTIIKPDPEPDAVCVYRGWMLSEDEYEKYTATVVDHGVTPLTWHEQYLAAHHFPNWYQHVERYTPSSVSFGNSPETPERVYNFSAGAFGATEGLKLQVKDYVKSLKTDGGSVATSTDEVKEILAKMEKYRGTIEGGIVLRKYEEFFPGSEVRYFVIEGKYFGQEKIFDLRHMNILEHVKDSIPSPFWSIDIALSVDGQARIVEIGDGQVSDLVGWTEERFAEIWK